MVSVDGTGSSADRRFGMVVDNREWKEGQSRPINKEGLSIQPKGLGQVQSAAWKRLVCLSGNLSDSLESGRIGLIF